MGYGAIHWAHRFSTVQQYETDLDVDFILQRMGLHVSCESNLLVSEQLPVADDERMAKQNMTEQRESKKSFKF